MFILSINIHFIYLFFSDFLVFYRNKFVRHEMLVLQELEHPTEGVMEAVDQVVAFWEKDTVGQGTLYLTERHLIWISPQTRKGFRLPIPSIVVHAASGASNDFPEPCLFLMVDYSKTDVECTPPDNNEDEDGDEEEDEEVKTVAVRLVPANASRISDLFATLNKCQELNPEPDEDMSGDENYDEHEEGEETVGELLHHNGDYDGDGRGSDVHEWFTEDSRTDEIRLSAEGRANMERILGSLSEDPTEQSNSQDQQSSQNVQQPESRKEEEHMDED